LSCCYSRQSPQQNSARIIVAAATSSATKAALVNCLLEPDCGDSWSPGSADSGANEGVYVQFESTVDSDMIEIVSNADTHSEEFTLSVNGARITPESSAKPLAGASRFVMRYSVPSTAEVRVFRR